MRICLWYLIQTTFDISYSFRMSSSIRTSFSQVLRQKYIEKTQYYGNCFTKVTRTYLHVTEFNEALSKEDSVQPVNSANDHSFAAIDEQINEVDHDEVKSNVSVKKVKKPTSKSKMKKMQQEIKAFETHEMNFNSYYSNIFGVDRWINSLRPALEQPGQHVALLNRRCDLSHASKVLGIGNGQSIPFLSPYFDLVFTHAMDDTTTDSLLKKEMEEERDSNEDDDEFAFKDVTRWPSPGAPSSLDPNMLCCYYPLDAASLLPVRLLDLQPHHKVLDLCAAPGGKALTILQHLRLSASDGLHLSNDALYGSLTCNDVSPDRRIRLKTVLRKYLPVELYEQVDVFIGDATSSRFMERFGKDFDGFDRILLDAPCSSERHLLKSKHNKEYLSWSVGRMKANADRQFDLLWNAMRLCRFDGRVVYSTCSINPIENDGVIEKLLHKMNKRSHRHQFSVEVVSIDSLPSECVPPFGESMSLGWQVLPDQWNGWGPIYCAILQKRSLASQ